MNSEPLPKVSISLDDVERQQALARACRVETVERNGFKAVSPSVFSNGKGRRARDVVS